MTELARLAEENREMKPPRRKIRKDLASIGMTQSYRSDLDLAKDVEWVEYFPDYLVKEVEEVLKIQGQSLTDNYMRGMYNGIECALSIMERREPRYVGPALGARETEENNAN